MTLLERAFTLTSEIRVGGPRDLNAVRKQLAEILRVRGMTPSHDEQGDLFFSHTGSMPRLMGYTGICNGNIAVRSSSSGEVHVEVSVRLDWPRMLLGLLGLCVFGSAVWHQGRDLPVWAKAALSLFSVGMFFGFVLGIRLMAARWIRLLIEGAALQNQPATVEKEGPVTHMETEASGSRGTISPWRTIVSMLSAQALCTVAADRLLPTCTGTQRLVIGLAVGTIAGLCVGLVWRLPRAIPETNRCRLPLFLTVGLAAVLITAGLWFVACRQAGQARLLERLTHLQPTDVLQITISRKGDSRSARVIEDQSLIREFLEACRDAQSFAPNHPSYQSTWLVTIQTKEVLQLECSYEASHSDLVIGSFIRAHGSSTSYYGSLSSRGLRLWFDRHVLSEEPGETGKPGAVTYFAGGITSHK